MIKITMIGNIVDHLMHDSLRRNSILLILSQCINAGFAFIFWALSAHLFSASAVGAAVAIMSFGGLISTFTNLGLPSTVIRFIPTSQKKGSLFTGSVLIVTFVSILGSILSIRYIDKLVPKLDYVKSSEILIIMLILLIVGNSVSTLLDGISMAYRKGQYILGKALVINIPRIILPVFFISLGLKGIVCIYVIMLFLGIFYNMYVIHQKLLKNESLKPNISELLHHRSYALGNYLGGMFATMPLSLLPILVLVRLGSTEAAYYYMPMQIAMFLNYIPSSTSQALMAESSQSNAATSLSVHFSNALKHIYRLLVPITILIASSGWLILRVYGYAYASNGYDLLLVLCIASMFVAINFLGDTWLNIKKLSRAFFLMNALNAIGVISFAYLFSEHGLLGIGVGWLMGQVLSASVYLVIFYKDGLLPAFGCRKILS